MRDLVFLKLGGSAITDKTRPEALDEGVLRQIAGVVATALHAEPAPRILMAHGGGSFGHHWAHLYQTHMGVHDARGWEGVARVADAMSRLNREVVRHLLDAGVNALSVQPSASAVASGRKLASIATEPLEALLGAGVVPVLYGDVVVDREQGAAIVSTEALFTHLARVLRPRRIVLVGEAAVYTADPRTDPEAEPIPIVDETNIDQVLQRTTGSHGVDVTGGMAAKVATMWQLVSSIDNLDVQLVGPDPVAIGWAIRGDLHGIGTLIRRRSGMGLVER